MSTSGAAAFDELLATPAYFQDPYPVLARIRDADPVYWSDRWGVWVVTRHEDVVAMLRDPRRFSNAGRFSTFLGVLPPEAAPHVEPLRRHYASGMLQSDPPDHARLRPLVNTALTPRVVAASRPRIQQLVADLIGSFRDRGEADLLREFAYPLPAIVICELMGVPVADREQRIELSDGVVGIQRAGRATVDEHLVGSARSIVGMEEYFRDLCHERRAHPRGDLITALVQAEEAGDRLDEAELISMCTTLMVAGHETTRNLIGNGLLLLLQRPADLARVAAEPDLWESAIEEMLRFESPVSRGWRRVAVDTSFGGRDLHEGQLVYLMLGAANRDPRVFAEPDRFDIARQANRHLAFGQGIHFCLGAPLTRLEARVGFPALIAALPGLRVDGDLRWHESVTHRGLVSLPVRFGGAL
ncbi:MAG: cytochrome P450 [Chloroflexi bacterium]|nr:cytochrome P450 [Chloroflexota bacterium]